MTREESLAEDGSFTETHRCEFNSRQSGFGSRTSIEFENVEGERYLHVSSPSVDHRRDRMSVDLGTDGNSATLNSDGSVTVRDWREDSPRDIQITR